MRRVRTVLVLISASIALPSIAAVHLDLATRAERAILHKMVPVPSGIYNLRRIPSTSGPKSSIPRRPRAKPASESVADLS
jgi:hypothetical protein